jgi:serine phosphatase RsbU (regulator of sigma subunit)/PAS domain-containing protein
LELILSKDIEIIERKVHDEKFVEIRQNPLTDGGVVRTYADITERKRVERIVTDQRQALAAVLENVVQAIVAVDKDLNLIACNRKFQDLLSLPDDLTLPGTTTRAMVEQAAKVGFYGEGDIDELVDARMAALTSGKSLRVEINTADGLIWYATLDQVTEGGFVMTYTDITERKAAELKLTNAYDVISSSINYAARIQRSVLPDMSLMDARLSDYLLIWEPRDVVGGDIYWCKEWGDGLLIVLGDCTGHGVPGAFMTLISTGALDNALSEVPPGNPGRLIQRIHQLVQITLGQHSPGSESDDGMELGACYLHAGQKKVTYAGARFELYMIKDSELTTLKGTKSGIGYQGINHHQEFKEQVIDDIEGASFYMSSDGLTDQIGGKKGRMFGKKRFKEVLLDSQHQSMPDQRDRIVEVLSDYQGGQARRDDVSVIGFKI